VTLRRGLSFLPFAVLLPSWRGKANVDMTLDIFDLLILVGDMLLPRDPNDDDDDDEDEEDDDEADDDPRAGSY